MRLGRAERCKRDSELLSAAQSYETEAAESVARAHPLDLEQLRACCASGNFRNRTPGPWRLGLRAIARTRGLRPALAAFRQADGAYWSVVTNWLSLIHKLAIQDGLRLQLPIDDLKGAYFLAGYEAAIRLDPERANFGTYFSFWRKRVLMRDPEALPLVYAGADRDGNRVRLPGILSLDVSQDEDGDLWVERMAGPWVDPSEVLAMDPARVFLAVDAHLPHRLRVVLKLLREVDNCSTIGGRLGYSRERARQNRDEILAVAREILAGKALARPCLWPRCTRHHRADGLCFEHASRLEPDEYAAFVGRPPTVDEVEALAQRVAGRS